MLINMRNITQYIIEEGKKVKLGITGGTPGNVVDKAKKDAEKIKEMDPKAKIEI